MWLRSAAVFFQNVVAVDIQAFGLAISRSRWVQLAVAFDIRPLHAHCTCNVRLPPDRSGAFSNP